MRVALILASELLAAPLLASAQALPPPPPIFADVSPPTITVSAQSSVETPPDRATLTLTIRGEGKTPDAATAALAAKMRAITNGLRTIDPKLEVRTGSVAMSEAHAGLCTRDSTMSLADAADALAAEADAMTIGDVPKGKPGVDPCKVIGNVAENETTIVLSSVKDAATAVGLAARLGATNAKVAGYSLSDDGPARTRAVAAVVAKARVQAQAIATASGMKLGPIVTVTDGSDVEGGLPAPAITMFDVLPPALDKPPVVVEITPTPVETSARLTVTFALEK